MRDRALAAILVKLRKERSALSQAVEAARDAATNTESQAEDSHDTRGVEASYLAAGQGKRLAEIDETIVRFEQAMGSLIELHQLEPVKKKTWVFLAPLGGGISFELDGVSGLVVSPASPLGEELQGAAEGATFSIEVAGGTQEKTYRIAKIYA
ncbi:MAG: GreA/GreB family elongation factor [Bdellovibrionales bacterium]|nr:GreA/GreB family elongation factor [Bdellovibrionales bacterium]